MEATLLAVSWLPAWLDHAVVVLQVQGVRRRLLLSYYWTTLPFLFAFALDADDWRALRLVVLPLAAAFPN